MCPVVLLQLLFRHLVDGGSRLEFVDKHPLYGALAHRLAVLGFLADTPADSLLKDHLELDEPVDMSVVQPAFVERGVWIRPFGRLVYTMPPYVIEPEDLSEITSAMKDVVRLHAV